MLPLNLNSLDLVTLTLASLDLVTIYGHRARATRAPRALRATRATRATPRRSITMLALHFAQRRATRAKAFQCQLSTPPRAVHTLSKLLSKTNVVDPDETAVFIHP